MTESECRMVLSLSAVGLCVDGIAYELGLPVADVELFVRSGEKPPVVNIIEETLAARLPGLIEISCNALRSVVENGKTADKLKAAGLILNSATALARLRNGGDS